MLEYESSFLRLKITLAVIVHDYICTEINGRTQRLVSWPFGEFEAPEISSPRTEVSDS